jgi:hypothetical protein
MGNPTVQFSAPFWPTGTAGYFLTREERSRPPGSTSATAVVLWDGAVFHLVPA